MYKEHKRIAFIIFISISIVDWLAKIKYDAVFEIVLTVTSIILGFYIAALSSLFGNRTLRKMGKVQDTRIKHKTQLGVLLTYYRFSVVVSVVTIILSLILMMIIKSSREMICEEFINILGSLLIGLTFASVYLMYKLLMLFITILKDSNKEKKD